MLLVIAGGAWFSFKKPTPPPPPAEDIDDLKKQFLAHLGEESSSQNTLDIPTLKTKPKKIKKKPPPKKPLDKRARGRLERKSLPMGVVLIDFVNVYKEETGRAVAYRMSTGDIVRVYPTKPGAKRHHIHPGVDVYLAETSKNIEAAGNLLPDKDGWVDKAALHVFDQEQAAVFTESMDAVTLGNDPNFSTFAFYERAMRNPDPVVHRFIGPRFIFLVSLHEDYSSSWGALYRDKDLKIRSLALLMLRKRGIGNSREIIEDLIKRLSELTQTRARGETEAEVIAILNILKDSQHPRVPVALAGFKEDWKQTQSKAVLDLLDQIDKLR